MRDYMICRMQTGYLKTLLSLEVYSEPRSGLRGNKRPPRREAAF